LFGHTTKLMGNCQSSACYCKPWKWCSLTDYKSRAPVSCCINQRCCPTLVGVGV